MANQKQPIELIVANGKKHLTKAEINNRRKSEIKAPNDKIRAPNYLSKSQKKEFNRIAKQLKDLKIMTNLDCDALARYVIAQESYNRYSAAIEALWATVSDGSAEILQISEYLKDFENLRDKAFKQCRQLAADLGLSIAPRCRIAVPKKDEDKPPTDEEKLFQAAL